MSNTDLEDDLRGTFERAAASVPQADDLTARATAGARRAQRRTWMVSGAAAVAVAGIAVAGFGLAGSQNSPTQPTEQPVAGRPPSVSLTPQVLSAQTVSGSWQPVRMVGAESLRAPRPKDPVLIFRQDGTWSGSDGCNGLHGTYKIGQGGAFTVTIGAQTLIGCENVPHTGVLRAAKRIAMTGDTLQFFGADGKEIAQYARGR